MGDWECDRILLLLEVCGGVPWSVSGAPGATGRFVLLRPLPLTVVSGCPDRHSGGFTDVVGLGGSPHPALTSFPTQGPRAET